MAIAIGACGSMDVICTEIGCEDGLVVELTGNPAGPWTVEVKEAGSNATPMTRTCPVGQNCGPSQFPGFLPSRVDVTVTAPGKATSAVNLTPTPNSVQPNGPRCEPTCQQPFVTMTLP